MEAVFDKLGTRIYKKNRHIGYLMKWKLVSPMCKRWMYNRESDSARVKEMIEFYKNGGYIPTLIHLADVHGCGIVCYDGNHRREVFEECMSSDDICMIDVMFDVTHQEVHEAFTNVNKSVQLPAMYIEEPSDIKTQIIDLVRSYEKKYKEFVSPSARCHVPNFNRDTFTDNIYDIYKAYNGRLTVADISNLLEKLNMFYANGIMCRPHSSYKESVITKCRSYNLWLFLERTIFKEHIEQVLQCSNRFTTA